MAVLELNEQSNSFLRPTIVKPRLLFRSLGRSPFRHASKSGERYDNETCLSKAKLQYFFNLISGDKPLDTKQSIRSASI